MRFSKILILLLGCFFCLQAFAAGPVVHVALGEKWLNLFAPEYQEEEKKLFLLGSLFPDIRYLGVVKRTQTHYKGITLEQIYKEKTPFKRGMLLHSYVDEFRDKIVRKKKMRDSISKIPSKLQNTFLKLVEDQYLYDQYNWSQIRQFLSQVPEEEKSFGIDTKSLMQWHTMLTVYFTATPSSILTQFALFDKDILMIDSDTAKNWAQILPEYAAAPTMGAYVQYLFTAFDKEFVQYAKNLKLQQQAFVYRRVSS